MIKLKKELEKIEKEPKVGTGYQNIKLIRVEG